VNHVEKQVLLCGYTVERMRHDYGIDLLLYTYTDEGEVENDTVRFQLKATDNLPLLKDGQTISFAASRADLDFWLGEWLPVILVVYDALADVAYWVYIQEYFQQRPDFHLALVGETVTVHLSKENIVNTDAVRHFARFKHEAVRRYWGGRHDAA
jgi:hypothetical protein